MSPIVEDSKVKIGELVSQINDLFATEGEGAIDRLACRVGWALPTGEDLGSLKLAALADLSDSLFAISELKVGAEAVRQSIDTTASFRGLSVVDATTIWASGTGGTFIRSVDGGNTWKVGLVAGEENLDFRDIVALDSDTAFALSIGNGESSRIYKTTDGGDTWSLQFKGEREELFLDAFSFSSPTNGVAMGDPVYGKFLLLKTTDGETWKQLPFDNMPSVVEGEQAFAASGTCLAIRGELDIWMVSGGAKARVFHSSDGGESWNISEAPLLNGAESQGIFSIAFNDSGQGVVVGGDFLNADAVENNLAVSVDDGKSWIAADGLSGYRSCAAFVDSRTVIAVGTNGADISSDFGQNWKRFSDDTFNSVASRGLDSTWGVGKDGAVYKISIQYALSEVSEEEARLREEDREFHRVYLPMADDPIAYAAFFAVSSLDRATNDPTNFVGGPDNLEAYLNAYGEMNKFQLEVEVSKAGLTSLTDEQFKALQRRIGLAKRNLSEWREQQALYSKPTSD